MDIYIALLRGVMPSGKNRIPKMSELREAIATEEFADVTTYIQSGNIVLRSPHPKAETSLRLSEIIRHYCGAELSVITTDAEELRRHLSGNPFGEGYAPARVFFTSTMDALPEEPLRLLLEEDFAEEQLRLIDDRLYMYLPKDASRSRLSNNYLEKRLKITATTRNANTLTRLIELAEALEPD